MRKAHRSHRAGRKLGDIALARTYTGDGRYMRRAGHMGEFALLAGTPKGPQLVRTTLTAMDIRDPRSSAKYPLIPEPEHEFPW